MTQLRDRFRARAAADRTSLQSAIGDRNLKELRRLAHGLSGTGGVFGFPEISAAAEAVEVAIDEGCDWPAIASLCKPLLDRLAEAIQPL